MDQFNLMEFGYRFFIIFLPFLFALSFHELAHGWVARVKGDRTAEMMGRLTMNPFAHADFVGTFLLPMAAIQFGWPLFGWAKPVPVNSRNLRRPKEDMFWIALAGPLSNVLQALVATFALFILASFMGVGSIIENQSGRPSLTSLGDAIYIFISFNLILALFNMLPLHPLDGAKVLSRFLPASANRFLEEQQMTLQIILIVFIVSGGFFYLARPVQNTTLWLVNFALNLAL